jgi:hypothetical protein
MDRKKITESNREAWNEVTPLHQKARKVNLEEKFRSYRKLKLRECALLIYAVIMGENCCLF